MWVFLHIPNIKSQAVHTPSGTHISAEHPDLHWYVGWPEVLQQYMFIIDQQDIKPGSADCPPNLSYHPSHTSGAALQRHKSSEITCTGLSAMNTELLDGLTASPFPPRFQSWTSPQGNVGKCSLCSQKTLNEQSLSQQMDLLQWLRSVSSYGFPLHSSSVDDLLISCHVIISSHYSNLATIIFIGDEPNYFTQLRTTRCIDQINFSASSLPITCLCPSTGKHWLLQETRNANA